MKFKSLGKLLFRQELAKKCEHCGWPKDEVATRHKPVRKPKADIRIYRDPRANGTEPVVSVKLSKKETATLYRDGPNCLLPEMERGNKLVHDRPATQEEHDACMARLELENEATMLVRAAEEKIHRAKKKQ